jgi:DNA-binding CsgD family transcriptional regulator
MPERGTNFESLLDQIYEAAIYPEKWSSTLHELSMISGCAGGIILLRRSDSWVGWRCSQGMRGAKAFMESDAPARSKTTERLLAYDRIGFVSDSDLFTEAEYKADSLVAEWAAPNQLHHSAATAIKPPSADLVVVHVQRSTGVRRFDVSDIALLDSFRPHLARAGLLAVRLQFERFNAIALGLELVGLPAILLDREGHALCANGLAQSMEDHIGWSASNRVYLRDRKADARLQDALRAEGLTHALTGCSIPSKPQESTAAIIHLIPVAGTARDLFEGGFNLLLVTPIGVKPAQSAVLLQGLFDLTPAEAEICRQLSRGYALDRIARERGCAVDTVRSQLKSIFDKTGTSRQSELVALLATVQTIDI